MSYVIRSAHEPIWTVGFYKPDGKWEAENHNDSESAARRVNFLNGGSEKKEPVKEPMHNVDIGLGGSNEPAKWGVGVPEERQP